MGIRDSRRSLGGFKFALLLSLLVVAARQPAPADYFSVLSQNMNRLFDDVDDGHQEQIIATPEFHQRIAGAVHKFGEEYGLPQVIALQEVENLNVLQQISAGIRGQYGIDYRAILIPGQDISSINIGFLVRREVTIRKTSQLFREHSANFGGGPLFARPPLRLDACLHSRCLSLVNLHLRSMRGIDSVDQGERVARKRRQQAETVALWVNQFQRSLPDAWLLLLGDFNALTPSDGHVDVAGIIRGNPDGSPARLPAPDLVATDLVDLTRRIPPGQRYSFIFRQARQQLDYVFVTQALANVAESIRFGAIDYRFSDHAGLLAEFAWQE